MMKNAAIAYQPLQPARRPGGKHNSSGTASQRIQGNRTQSPKRASTWSRQPALDSQIVANHPLRNQQHGPYQPLLQCRVHRRRWRYSSRRGDTDDRLRRPLAVMPIRSADPRRAYECAPSARSGSSTSRTSWAIHLWRTPGPCPLGPGSCGRKAGAASCWRQAG